MSETTTPGVIFASGSIAGGALPKGARQVLAQAMRIGHTIIVGDASGIDTGVQRFLADADYRNVEVFHIDHFPRNLIDTRWITRHIQADSSDPVLFKKGKPTRQAQMLKDSAMADRATGGLAIWRDTSINRFGKTVVSKGTLRNMVQLLTDEKPVMLHLVEHPELGILRMNNMADLREVVTSFGQPSAIEYFEQIAEKQGELSLFSPDFSDPADKFRA